MKFDRVLICLCCSFVIVVARPSVGGAQAGIPDITLRITVQQKEGNTLDSGLHLMTLSCLSGVCTLQSASLNQCSRSPVTGNLSFAVVTDHNSTAEGNLRVTNHGNVLLVEERSSDLGGTSINTLRFGYRQNPATLTSFSGGFVKNSDLAGKVISVEYVPLIGAYSERRLDCPVRLPGVERN